jgi:hypothetical protein
MRFWQRVSHIGRFLLRPNTSGVDSQPYTISANVNLVIVPVTVTGHEHHFVSGLDAAKFRVYEEGRPQMLFLLTT